MLWGDGTAKRELIHVDDACDVMLNLLDEENQVFNLGSGEDHSINTFAKYVCESYNYDYNLVEHDLTKYVGVKSKSLDTRKVSDYFDGKYIKTSLKDGIKESVHWYLNKKK